MNISSVLGLLLAAFVFLATVIVAVGDASVLYDVRSLLVVVGGSLAAIMICFPISELGRLLVVFMKRILGMNRQDYLGLISQLTVLSKAFLQSKRSFESAIPKIRDPFLKDGAEILFWAESSISNDELRDLLETRAETHFDEYMGSADRFRIVAKFPPAFGLMGTTVGLMALLRSLGGKQSLENIGPGMAVALITTLYGLAIANFIFIPIAENLTKQSKDDFLSRSMVVEGLMLIQENKPTRFVEEKLKSYLLPRVRNKKIA